MKPELFKLFVAEFTTEWNRLQAEAGTSLVARRGEIAAVKRRIDGLIQAIEEGLYEPSMKTRMQGLERRREALEAELAAHGHRGRAGDCIQVSPRSTGRRWRRCRTR